MSNNSKTDTIKRDMLADHIAGMIFAARAGRVPGYLLDNEFDRMYTFAYADARRFAWERYPMDKMTYQPKGNEI